MVLFHVASSSLEIAKVLSFLKKLLEILKEKKNNLILKILKISEKSNCRIIANS